MGERDQFAEIIRDIFGKHGACVGQHGGHAERHFGRGDELELCLRLELTPGGHPSVRERCAGCASVRAGIFLVIGRRELRKELSMELSRICDDSLTPRRIGDNFG